MARASVYMPDLSEVGLIIAAIPEHWSVAQNPRSRFRNARARTFFSRRDQAIVGVQISTGLRISETFGLCLQDYSAEQACLTVTESKSGRPRTVPVSATLARLLQDWLRVRPEASPSSFLFITEFGEQLHRDSWGHQFQRYVEFTRTQGHPLPRITLHSLRHLAGTAMAEHNLYHASLMLGHSSIQITADNYLHARADQIRATHEVADPLARILTRGRPVGVVPMLTDNTCCIAASYEAKCSGVKTGTSVTEARALCPNVEIVPARPRLYRSTHFRILEAVETVVPIHQVLSVDEMVVRPWRNEAALCDALRLGQRVQDAIRRGVGEWLTCSVGLAPNAFLAKVASDLQKPRGLSVLSADDLPHKLYGLKLTDWPGIAKRMERRFNSYGVTTTEGMYALSMAQMREVFGGIVGERWWRLIRG